MLENAPGLVDGAGDTVQVPAVAHRNLAKLSGRPVAWTNSGKSGRGLSGAPALVSDGFSFGLFDAVGAVKWLSELVTLLCTGDCVGPIRCLHHARV